MTKEEFLKLLDSRLDNVTIKDKMETLEYYSEMIDDRIEDGLSMEEAVRDLGDIDDIMRNVIKSLHKSDFNPRNNNTSKKEARAYSYNFDPQTGERINYNNERPIEKGRIIENNNRSNSQNVEIKGKNDLTTGEIIAIVLLFPIWLPLLAIVGSIVLALFVALWAAVIAFIVASIASIGGGIFAFFGGIAVMLKGSLSIGALTLSKGLMALGGGLIILALLKYIILGAIKLNKSMYFAIRGICRRSLSC